MEEIRIGRLLKKIEKLKKQRDHFKSALEHYQYVLDKQPYLLKRFNNYKKLNYIVKRISSEIFTGIRHLDCYIN